MGTSGFNFDEAAALATALVALVSK